MKRNKNKKLEQFLDYSGRLNKMLSDGRFKNLTGKKKFSLVKRLSRLYKQLEEYYPSKALKTAMAGAAFLVLTLMSNNAEAQNFASPQTNPFGLVETSDYAFPELVDIDNDGDLDLFSGEYYGGMKFFRNIGTAANPIFDNPLQNPFGLDSIWGYVAVIDFVDIDDDGDLDAFVGSTYGNFLYHENIGNASLPDFANGVTNPFGIGGLTEFAFPELTDIDNDGDYDLFMGAYEGVFQYFENTGTASAPAFAAPIENPFNLTSMYQLALPSFVDIDDDGDMDLFAGSYSPNLSFYRNIGTAASPNFESAIENPFSISPVQDICSPDFGDLDDDGDMDLFVGEYLGNHIYFENITIPDDLGVWSIVDPLSSCELTASEHLSLQISNFGTDPQTGFSVTYTVNGTGGATEIYSGTITPGDFGTLTFTATEDFFTNGDYEIVAWTSLAGDSNTGNDTLYSTIISKPFVNSFPYLEDFESGTGGWSSTGSNNTWELGTPAGDVINSAASGVGAWMTSLSDYYNDDEQSYVESPCFDLSTILDPYISFDLWYVTEEGYDGVQIQYSIDGSTWNSLGSFLNTDWYNIEEVSGLFLLEHNSGWSGFSDSWQTYTHSIIECAGQSNANFRIFFGSDGSVYEYDGVAFDNFMVFENPSETEELSNLDIEVYPNPSNGIVHILNAGNAKVEVRNLLGSLVLNENLPDNNSALDLSFLPTGTYIVKIKLLDKVINKKVVLKK